MSLFDTVDYTNVPPPALPGMGGFSTMDQYLLGPNVQAAPPPVKQASPLLQTLTQAPEAPQTPVTNPDDAITINSWKPHHRTTLGAVADIGLALLGLPIAPFANKARRENMQEAMEGFTQDPLETIRRLSKIPGMEQKAFQLYEQYAKLHSNDDIDKQKLNYYQLGTENMGRSTISSYLGGIGRSSNPEKVYDAMLPKLQSIAQEAGLDPTELPNKWNPDIASTLFSAGVKPADQARIGETNRHNTEMEGLRKGEILQTGAYREARLGQMNQHEQAYENHNQTMEGIAQQRAKHSGKAPVTYLRTKYGPGEVSPDGTAMRVQVGNTNHFYTKVGPNQWKHVKTAPVNPKSPGSLTYDGSDYEDDSDEDDN